MNMHPIPWLSVSGLDGSGKTTLVNNLKSYMSSCGLRVKSSRLPYDQHLVTELLNVSNDPYTDRMLFALDNRLFAERFKAWQNSGKYDFILTQRCYLDSYVHGAVQGFNYAFISELNRINDLPHENIIIHLVAEAETAYARIKDDDNADKFEYIEYIRRQERETRRAYYEVTHSNKDLEHFKKAIHLYVDTTQMSTNETFEYVKKWLNERIGF